MLLLCIMYRSLNVLHLKNALVNKTVLDFSFEWLNFQLFEHLIALLVCFWFCQAETSNFFISLLAVLANRDWLSARVLWRI